MGIVELLDTLDWRMLAVLGIGYLVMKFKQK